MDNNERPKTINKILKTTVVLNPFDDIEPRYYESVNLFVRKKIIGERKRRRERRRRKKRNRKLLRRRN